MKKTDHKLREEIVRVLPTTRMDAISKDQIAEMLEMPPMSISIELKRMRLGGLPILWNCKWVYIDYAHNAIKRQHRTIENMKKGYMNWMNNIQEVFNDIIAWKYETE